MSNRSYSPTTLVIFEEILKQVSSPPNYFYPRDLVDELGVSRQHITNLLTRLVGNGLLERDRGRYTCPAGQLPSLIEYVVNASHRTDNPNVRLFSVDGVFNKQDVDTIRGITNVVLKAQGTSYTNYPNIKQNWIDRLEQAQSALKRELKFLKGHNSTTAKIDDETFEQIIGFLDKAE